MKSSMKRPSFFGYSSKTHETRDCVELLVVFFFLPVNGHKPEPAI